MIRSRDLVAASALAAIAVAALFAGSMSEPEYVTRTADVLGVALVLAMTLPLAAVRTRPRAATAVAGTAALAASLTGYGFQLAALIVWVAVGVAALYLNRRWCLAFGVASSASVAVSVAAYSPSNRDVAALALACAVGAMPALVGDAQRRQRELTDEVRRLQRAELERAVDAERVRIARDVHDTVGHHLSAISLQANAGQLEDAPLALRTIARLSARAIDDTRHTLGILRASAGMRPPPRLEHLPDLVATAELAGVDVEVSVDGATDDLPDVVSTCAYRVIQEALTNTAKHAAPARAQLRIRRASGRLTLTLTDDGRAASRPVREGLGIAGMRERVTSLGGSFSAAPGPGAGWHVRADVPDRL